MNPISPPVHGKQQLNEQRSPSFWGTPSEALVWVALIMVAACVFFGIGVLAGLTAIITFLVYQSTQRDSMATVIRSLFAKVVITGVAYQFIGTVLISAPNVRNANSFFENAGVDASGVRLVDSLNYRKSMHEMEISGDEFSKLVAFYRDKAEQDKECSYGHPDRFAYFELEPDSIGLEYFEKIGYHYEEFVADMMDFEKSEDNALYGDDWLDTQNLIYDLTDLLEGFSEINKDQGYGRVLIWHGRGGDNRVFIWFEKNQTGYLKCEAGFG